MNEDDTAPQPARPPSGAPRPGRIMWGRIISLAGALGLCVSFFLPHWGNIGVYSPQEWMGQVTDGFTSVSISDLFAILIVWPFMTGAMLAPLLACRLMGRADTRKGAGIFLAWGQSVVCLVVMISLLALRGYTFIYSWRMGGAMAMEVCVESAAGFAGLALALLALTMARLPRKAAASLFGLGLHCLVLFLVWIIPIYPKCDTRVVFGLWVSLFASGLLVLGAAVDWFQCRPGRPAAPA